MVRKRLLFVLLLVSSALFGQGIIIDKGWEVKSGQNPQSEVRADDLLLRLYSPVFNNTLDYEVSKITIDVTWLNPMSVSFGIDAVCKFDDGHETILSADIPAKTKTYTLTYVPKYWKGRVLKRLEFRHGQTALEGKITTVRIFPENTPPVFLDQSQLGTTKFVTPKQPKYRVVSFGWDTKEADLPYLTGQIPGKILVTCAKVAPNPDQKMDIEAVLKDKSGNTIKVFKLVVDATVQDVNLEFKGVDMVKVDKIIFRATGTGNWASIRRVIAGAEAPPPPVAKCDGVAPINRELEKVIDQLKKENISNDSLMKLLQILKMYQGLER